MEIELSKFLENLKVVATSPYALVAYLSLVGAWMYIATAGHRLKNITKVIRDLSEQDRIEILKREYNTMPRVGLSAEQWLRSRKYIILFLGFVLTLLAVVILALVAIERQPATNKNQIRRLEPPVIDWTPANSTNDTTEVTVLQPQGLVTDKTPANSTDNTTGANVPPVQDLTTDRKLINQTNDSGITLRQLLEGKPPNASNRVFEVTISNASTNQIILNKFSLRWRYHRGFAAAIDHGEPLVPVAQYVLEIPIDTVDESPKSRVEVLYPPLLIPPRNESGPSLTTFRLQLHYYFTRRLSYHPCHDWRIEFKVAVLDDAGHSLVVIPPYSWHHTSE